MWKNSDLVSCQHLWEIRDLQGKWSAGVSWRMEAGGEVQAGLEGVLLTKTCGRNKSGDGFEPTSRHMARV